MPDGLSGACVYQRAPFLQVTGVGSSMRPDTDGNSGKVHIQRSHAVIKVLLGIVMLLTSSFPESGFFACAFFVSAWTRFYYPAPSLRSTPGEIYQSIRKGQWVQLRHMTLISLVGLILGCIGIYFQFNHWFHPE